MISQEAGEAFLVIKAECLVRGDVHSRVLGSVAAFFSSDDACVVAKSRFEFGVGLLAQLVAVAEEQGRLGQLSGLI